MFCLEWREICHKVIIFSIDMQNAIELQFQQNYKISHTSLPSHFRDAINLSSKTLGY